ncbi:HU family DNA-binding protein [Roseivirga thermotolerans]|uniref:DNA-binding protein HU-beta n=1 Tax=Roseivirga thermotolerans TaxID=1758176 RepID=A0ABQ3I983_9BACT|nr:HU family DNA-binding protein [Roseivirga thermotolerans]GHE64998.1 DNA-binding protein HU-beta [Roseivirga thermotolerans]
MTKKQLIYRVSKSTGITYKDTELVIEAFLQELLDQWRARVRVAIRGFGTFTWKKQAAKKGRDINKGKTINIPARMKPVFKPSKQLF